MKKSFVFIFTVFMGLLFIFASDPGPKPVNLKDLDLKGKPLETQQGCRVKSDINFGRIPLYFITNKGQVNEKAKFYAKASKYTLWLIFPFRINTRQIKEVTMHLLQGFLLLLQK